MRFTPTVVVRAAVAVALGAGLLSTQIGAQSRLRSMPGYAQYQKMARELPTAVKSGALNVMWRDAQSFEYARDGNRYRYDLSLQASTEVAASGPQEPSGRGGRTGAPARGRQVDSSDSPDGKLKAFYRDRNLWLSDAVGGREIRITTDGGEKARIKYGTASWVYGEELGQTTAMWWSPDSRKIAYYRFDEQKVPDYYLQVNQTTLQSAVDTEAYPKAGMPNPVVDLFVY